jgi:hypothetical protein
VVMEFILERSEERHCWAVTAEGHPQRGLVIIILRLAARASYTPASCGGCTAYLSIGGGPKVLPSSRSAQPGFITIITIDCKDKIRFSFVSLLDSSFTFTTTTTRSNC